MEQRLSQNVEQTNKLKENIADIRVEIATHKEQIVHLCELCHKIDEIIEKLDEQHRLYIEKLEHEQQNTYEKSEKDIERLNERIATLNREIELTKNDLRVTIEQYRHEYQQDMENLKTWRWAVGGAITVIVWILSKLDIISIFKKIV